LLVPLLSPSVPLLSLVDDVCAEDEGKKRKKGKLHHVGQVRSVF
jgi:hypothetical protein